MLCSGYDFLQELIFDPPSYMALISAFYEVGQGSIDFTQLPETRTVQNLFMPGMLINIWWKIRCLQHLNRNILGDHNEGS